MSESEWFAFLAAIRIARLVLSVGIIASGMLMHRRLSFDGRAFRKLGINGEIALVHEGWRRDAAVLIASGLFMLIATLLRVRRAPIDVDDFAILILCALGFWIGIKRLKDRRFAELIAEIEIRRGKAKTGVPQ